MVLSFSDYVDYYTKLATDGWHNITPTQYGYLLISIAVVGWILMKSGQK
jgi:hypothetical protein